MTSLMLKLAGGLLLLLAVANLFLPRKLDWKNDLAGLSLLNRQIFRVHAFFIVLILVMMGALSLGFTAELLAPSPLSRLVLGGLALFWFIRLAVQLFVYDSSLWRGNRVNTFIHFTATLLWAFFTAVYGAALWRQLQP
jgi:hypothetical protein